MPTFDTPGPIAATVVVGGAQVRVTASDRTDTVVLVEPINKTSKKDVKGGQQDQGRLSPTVSYRSKRTVSGDESRLAITTDLPACSSLVAYLAHSDVRADGSLGECEAAHGIGSCSPARSHQLQRGQRHRRPAEVTIGHIAGRASIDGAAFAMQISEVQDIVRLSSSGGQTWIGHASADLDLSSGSGGFDIDRADGSVTAKTGDGTIRIGRLTRGQAELLNGSGNIEVGISEGTAASVDANSERGSVRNSVPPQENLETSDNKVTVHARTRHGDIIIQRASCSSACPAESPRREPCFAESGTRGLLDPGHVRVGTIRQSAHARRSPRAAVRPAHAGPGAVPGPRPRRVPARSGVRVLPRSPPGRPPRGAPGPR